MAGKQENKGVAFAAFADFFGQLALVFAVCVADPARPPDTNDTPPSTGEASAPDERRRIRVQIRDTVVSIDGHRVGVSTDPRVSDALAAALGPPRADTLVEIDAMAETRFDEWLNLAPGLEGWAKVCSASPR